QECARKFWEWRAQHMPISYDDIPRLERPAGWVPDWSAGAIAGRQNDLGGFTGEWQSIDPSAWTIEQQADYRLIGSALARVSWDLDITRGQEINPDFYVQQTLGAIFLSLLNPARFDPQRAAEIITRLRSIPATVEDAKQNLAHS